MALIRQGVSGNETVSDIETVAGVEGAGAGVESPVPNGNAFWEAQQWNKDKPKKEDWAEDQDDHTRSGTFQEIYTSFLETAEDSSSAPAAAESCGIDSARGFWIRDGV